MRIRQAEPSDWAGIWAILEPILRGGEHYALPRDWSEAQARAFWLRGDECFVAEDAGRILGTYYVRPNAQGGGAHVANGGYAVADDAAGRGVGRALCQHSLDEARRRGFRAMQFNFVIASNERAVHLWKRLGFAEAGRLPGAFAHPRLGYIDALVMFRAL
ncbi:MAG: GNAT family N-acetyltransferase [Hyphomonadaceae bacterium]